MKQLSQEEQFRIGKLAEKIFFCTIWAPHESKPVWFSGLEIGTGFDDGNGIDGFAVVSYSSQSQVKIPVQVKASWRLFPSHYQKHPHLKGKLVEMDVGTFDEDDPGGIRSRFYVRLGEIRERHSPEIFERLLQEHHALPKPDVAPQLNREKIQFVGGLIAKLVFDVLHSAP